MKTVSLHYYFADCLHVCSKRTSGFDMAPSNADVLHGAAVPGLHLNSLLTYSSYYQLVNYTGFCSMRNLYFHFLVVSALACIV